MAPPLLFKHYLAPIIVILGFYTFYADCCLLNSDENYFYINRAELS